MTPEILIGAIIPTYRHVKALPSIVDELVARDCPVIIIDDGNAPEQAQQIAALADPMRRVQVVRLSENGGKGVAVKAGFKQAAECGWTHAIQIDADGQHDISQLPEMMDLCRRNPKAVICAIPVYDHTIPKGRKIGREITHFWVRVETLSLEINDSMCGFRIYPLEDAVHVISRELIGARMDFDTEILVQLNWRGLRVVEHPTKVIYPAENVSNFRMLWDNVRISAMHTRLAVQAPFRVPIRSLRRLLTNKYPKIS
ncbi:glycosyltransferase family 2 protein [Hirschia maritima]|uniref:glycosyltransferase family 2 protein n=1 Tax=Hirschia maritima TaxID=1121961 RepID=UPI00036FBF63|nr:glycosyltransferase family 2 protein [Hirschia maritima]